MVPSGYTLRPMYRTEPNTHCKNTSPHKASPAPHGACGKMGSSKCISVVLNGIHKPSEIKRDTETLAGKPPYDPPCATPLLACAAGPDVAEVPAEAPSRTQNHIVFSKFTNNKKLQPGFYNDINSTACNGYIDVCIAHFPLGSL
eukprot:3123041-Amphidinium_carterae.1